MKIAVYSICKNEENEVASFLENVQDADVITVCDTGSTDDTVKALPEVHSIRVDPWSFGIARNVALALVPGDVDVCIRLDLDERLGPGWRAALEKSWVPGTQQLWYDYEYCTGFSFHANYVHARSGFYWKGIDHEGLYSDQPPKGHFCNDFKIIHHQKQKEGRANILARLERQVCIEPSARSLWYLGREYFYYKRWADCITMMTNYLGISDWAIERMAAYIMISSSEMQLGNRDAAHRAAHKAVLEYPTRESYAALSETARDPAYGRAIMDYGMTFQNDCKTIHRRPELWKKPS